MIQFHSHKARAVLVADPDAQRDLIDFASELLLNGGTSATIFEFGERSAQSEAILTAHIRDKADLVVLLRTEKAPSHEITTAMRIAREHGKPIHALVEVGVSAGVDVDETHAIEQDPSWDGRQELYRWGAGLAERYGRPTTDQS